MEQELRIKLLASIKRGKELFDLVASDMKDAFLIGGKTMEHWRNRFNIPRPPTDADPEVCKSLGMDILVLYQEASFLYSKALAYEQISTAAAEDTYKSRRREIVEEYATGSKRLPGADALDQLVSGSEEVAGAKMAADMGQVHKDFFKQILDRLSNTRKVIENISMNNAVQAKLEQGHHSVPTTPHRE